MKISSNWDILKSEELPLFLENIESYLIELNLSEKVQPLHLDHLGLRFEDMGQIEFLANEIGSEGELISSAIVNGRKILIFELKIPLIFGKWEVPCIELPYPKNPHEYSNGWEHLEFVVPSEAKSLEDFRKDLLDFIPDLNIEKLKLKHEYSESLPKADSDKIPNPSIILRKEQNIAIKFHPNSIKKVVKS